MGFREYQTNCHGLSYRALFRRCHDWLLSWYAAILASEYGNNPFLVNTVLGKEVWNLLRRKLSATWYPFKTDPEYGGPITFHDLHSVEEPTNSQPDRHSLGLPLDPSVSTALSQDEHSALFTSRSSPNSRAPSLSLLSLRQRNRQNIPQIPWSERPRWIRMWFFTRPHLAGRFNMEQGPVPEYRSLVPAYTSFRGTLPLYLTDRSLGWVVFSLSHFPRIIANPVFISVEYCKIFHDSQTLKMCKMTLVSTEMFGISAERVIRKSSLCELCYDLYL